LTLDTTERDCNQQSYLSPVVVDTSSFDPSFRQSDLGRWTLPMKRSSLESASEEAIQLEKEVDRQRLDRLHSTILRMKDVQESSQGDSAETKTGPWTLATAYGVAAQLGQVMFPLSNTSETSHGTSDSMMWLHSIPGLTKVLTDPDFESKSGNYRPNVEFRFVAEPGQSSFSATQEFPSLLMQFRDTPKSDYTLKKMNLSFGQHEHYMLFPDKSVDIRFHRMSRVAFDTDGMNEKISSYMQTVCSIINSGKKLAAPDIELDIPTWAIPGYETQEGTHPVRYRFVESSIRQNLPAIFQGTRVLYSASQSGKLGRKTAGLSAFYDQDTEKVNSLALRAFLMNCLRIVNKITFAMSNPVTVTQPEKPERLEKPGITVKAGPTKRPRDEKSVRRLRRRELFGSIGETSESSAVANTMDNADAAAFGHEHSILQHEAIHDVSNKVPSHANGEEWDISLGSSPLPNDVSTHIETEATNPIDSSDSSERLSEESHRATI
jgi:hypothetical protein